MKNIDLQDVAKSVLGIANGPRKQDWTVTITITEREGSLDATNPWYHCEDIRGFVEQRIKKDGEIRGLEIKNVVAVAVGQPR